ncbi:MAG: hypothetical protein WBW69_24030 [Candidatus Korobacteraceae bacterium]
MFSTHVVVPHEDEAVGVVLILPELNVSKLQRNQLPAAQSGAQGG